MYGIFTYMWLIFMVNVGKYTSPMDPIWVMKKDESTQKHSSLVLQPTHLRNIYR